MKKNIIFGLIQKEHCHLLWFLYTIFFGLINLWAALLTCKIDNVNSFINSGNLYTFSISICAPLCFNLLINFIKTKKSNRVEKFVSKKIITILLNIIFSFILCFLMFRESVLSIWLQISITIISIIFSFYMYALLEIEPFENEYSDDKPYNEEEDENRHKNNESIIAISQDGDIKL